MLKSLKRKRATEVEDAEETVDVAVMTEEDAEDALKVVVLEEEVIVETAEDAKETITIKDPKEEEEIDLIEAIVQTEEVLTVLTLIEAQDSEEEEAKTILYRPKKPTH